MVLGTRLKMLRENMGLTQENLGKKLHVSKVSICKYETGISEPSLDILVKIADIFDVSTDYLLGREEKQKERWF